VSNAALSTVQQIITVLLALLGVIVALRPPRKGTWKEFSAIGVFVVLGIIGVYATYAQGERLDAASTQQKLQLDAIPRNTEQVPKVVVENKLDPQVISNAVQQGLRQPSQKSQRILATQRRQCCGPCRQPTIGFSASNLTVQ
jgi:hypothetical protein